MTLSTKTILALGGFTAVFGASVAVGSLVANGGSSSRPAIVERVDQVHDFGVIDITTGSRDLHHEFGIRNDSDRAIRIRDVIVSCGCLGVKVNSEDYVRNSTFTVAANESVPVEPTVGVPSPGGHLQTATALLSDGSKQRFIVRAKGVADERFKVFLHRVVAAGKGVVAEVRIYLIGMTTFDDLVPAFASDELIDAEFAGWSILEEASAELARPSRAVGKATLILKSAGNDKHAHVAVTVKDLASKSVRVSLPAL